MPQGALPRSASLAIFVSLGLGLGQGCRSSSLPGGTTGEAVPCDPLAAGPITPGRIVGVGQDADGTLYVDAANGVFVSAGGALIRQRLLGTGPAGANEFIFSFESPAAGAGGPGRGLLGGTAGAAPQP